MKRLVNSLPFIFNFRRIIINCCSSSVKFCIGLRFSILFSCSKPTLLSYCNGKIIIIISKNFETVMQRPKGFETMFQFNFDRKCNKQINRNCKKNYNGFIVPTDIFTISLKIPKFDRRKYLTFSKNIRRP